MNSYMLSVKVRAFEIERIEGFSRFPLRLNEIPTPAPGGMRMVYSSNPDDAAVCVDSAFINSIKPKQDGLYVEYPDGHAVFWSLDDFARTSGAESVDGGMSFTTALMLARKGVKVYRRDWMMEGVYLQVIVRDGQEILTLRDERSTTGQISRDWTPNQPDMFKNDWAIYEEAES